MDRGGPATRLALTELEEGILAMERATSPWVVQLEVGAAGALNPDRLAMAVRRACERHPLARAGSERCRRIAVSVPVNTRPEFWRWDVVGNHVALITVAVDRAQRADDATLLAAVSAQTDPGLRARRSRGLLELLRLLRPTPVAFERLVARVLAGGRFVDSVVLSNLGRLPEAPHFDVAGPRLWFSPPAPMPIGVGIGILTADGTLRLCLRHRLELLDATAAEAFVDRYLDALDELWPR